MFQPHSVRGLLSRRNKTRLEGEEQLEAVPAGGDTDLDSMVEGKLFIKDIQHKIEDIRQWRDHQTSLLKEKLASNQAVAKVTVEEYLKHLQKQEQVEAEERQKMMKKLQVKGQQMQLQAGEANTWSNADTNLFQCLAASNRTVDQRKYELQTGEVGSHPQTLINDLENISQAILRREDKTSLQNSDKKVIDRALLKKQLQEIDDELREIEQLLKD